MQGTELQRLRKANGMRQAELAELLGVSVATISKWENDELTIHVRSKDVERLLESTCKCMEQLLLLKEGKLSDTERVSMAPVDFGEVISQGDLLILSSKKPQAGSTVLLYDKYMQPQQIGQVLKVEDRDEYILLLAENKYKTMPDGDRCRVIEAVLHNLD